MCLNALSIPENAKGKNDNRKQITFLRFTHSALWAFILGKQSFSGCSVTMFLHSRSAGTCGGRNSEVAGGSRSAGNWQGVLHFCKNGS